MTEHTAPLPDLARLVHKWQHKRGCLIMALHEIQERLGYVPREVSLELAKLMGVPLARIYEVLTFYHYFRIAPPGRHIVSVCLGTACYLKGGSDLLRMTNAQLGVKEGETTSDGEFHLQSVRCVGCCGMAPVVVMDGRAVTRVRPDDISDLLRALPRRES